MTAPARPPQPTPGPPCPSSARPRCRRSACCRAAPPLAAHQRAAVLAFRPPFSLQVTRCSFLREGINPFRRDGVYLDRVNVELLKDDAQPGASSIIDQVSQVTLLRVLLPWMIGRAFERLSDPDFIDLLANNVNMPLPGTIRETIPQLDKLPPLVRAGLPKSLTRLSDQVRRHRRWWHRPPPYSLTLGQMLQLAAEDDPRKSEMYRGRVGAGVQY